MDAPVVAPMQFYYDEPAIPARDKMYLAFALGRVFDDNGQYDKAFGYFREGNRLKRATVAFNIAGEQALVERTRSALYQGVSRQSAAFRRPMMKHQSSSSA